MTDANEKFRDERRKLIAAQGADGEIGRAAQAFMLATIKSRYSYNFDWLGRPIIQYPQDIVATQELIWRVRPDLIIETGIAHGGSLVLSASVLALIDYAEAAEKGEMLDPRAPRRKVLGIDIEVRPHNRAALAAHPLRDRIEIIEGSSTAPEVVAQVKSRAKGLGRVMVFLDSNHTHEHVLAELEAYAPLTTAGSYCVVFDTVVEDLPEGLYPDRPWGKGDNPKTAVHAYLAGHPEFAIDREIENKLLITVAPDGFLQRIA